MTGDVVNLNKARKAKARNDARAGAEANRIRFGRTKLERATTAEATRRADRTLDQHRLEREPKGED